MEGLPFQPGNTFEDVTKNHYHRSQTLGYRNGCQIPKRPDVAIGGMTLAANRLSDDELNELASYRPTLTYGQAKQALSEAFVPAHVALDKKVLRFYAWFKQTTYESPAEHYRVRPVLVYYYLEDDTLHVVEPHVENSGIYHQGSLVNRQPVPKDDVGNHWHWKDLNNGISIAVYGKIFHLYDCDKFTREWLESEGIEVNGPQDCPLDPYMEQRLERVTVKQTTTPSDFDKLRQFLEMDRKVLRLYCVCDDRDRMFGQLRKFVIQYYLSNDTMEIVEVREANDGYDPFPMFMARHRCPKNRDDIDLNFPLGAMDISDEEVKEYFSPVDFKIGKSLVIYGRRFLIYDVDGFTKAFYWKSFGLTDFTPVDVEIKKPDLPKAEVPPYNYHGSLGDSMQNVHQVIPVTPKRDFVKYMDNQGKILRYEAKLDLPKKEDRCRRFIISYHLSNDMISVYEPPIANSGFPGGKFLDKARVSRPGCTPEKPTFYGPQDFYIGAVVDFFRHRFVIIDADYYVLKYMEDHAHQFPEVTLCTIREKLAHKGCRDPCQPLSKSGPLETPHAASSAELECIVDEVKHQLRKLVLTSKHEPHRIFLDIDVGRTGYITKENLREACINRNLPCHDEVIDCLASQIGRDPEHITLEELRKFLDGQ